MHVCYALEETVFHVRMNEQCLAGAITPERNALVHVCVLHECPFAFVYRFTLVHTYAPRHLGLFTLAARKKHTCPLVVLRLVVCE